MRFICDQDPYENIFHSLDFRTLFLYDTMRKVNLYRIVALLQFVHTGFAVPVAHAVPRSRVCANAPNTIART